MYREIPKKQYTTRIDKEEKKRMAYRRRQGMGRSSTFKEERTPPPEEGDRTATYSTSSSLAAQAIMASAAHRDASHSSAYAHSGFKDHSKVPPLVFISFFLFSFYYSVCDVSDQTISILFYCFLFPDGIEYESVNTPPRMLPPFLLLHVI